MKQNPLHLHQINNDKGRLHGCQNKLPATKRSDQPKLKHTDYMVGASNDKELEKAKKVCN